MTAVIAAYAVICSHLVVSSHAGGCCRAVVSMILHLQHWISYWS